MAQRVRRSKLGSLLAIGYLAVFLVAECLTLYELVFHTARSEFSGLGIILVALPWSMMLSPVWNAVGRFAGTPLIYGLLTTVTVLPGVLLNTALAYSFGWVIGQRTEPSALTRLPGCPILARTLRRMGPGGSPRFHLK